MTPNLLRNALDLAAQGIPVFPCGRNKKPCIPEAEGGHGFLDASSDPAEVERLFRHPWAKLIGMPTGPASGYDVLDLDPRHGSDQWWAEQGIRIPETRIHQSQSGGRHFLFQHHAGVANSQNQVGQGVDVRGQGGYAVIPPSAGYRIISDAPAATWPDWLLPAVLPKPRAKPQRPASDSSSAEKVSNRRLQAYIARILENVRRAADGAKHVTLRDNARTLGGIAEQAGFTDDEAARWLLDALPPSVEDWVAAEKTARWGLAQGREAPIELEDRDWQPYGAGHSWRGDHGASENREEQRGPDPEPEEPPKQKRAVTLCMIDPRKWTELPPPRQWIVPGWVPRGVVTGLYGDGGVGKSLLAMQLLTSTALCLPWLGIDVTPGRALGVFCEDDDDELQRRQWAINRLYGVEPENLENLRYLSRLGQDNALLQFDGSDIGRPTAFASQLHDLCGEFHPDLLVLDTAADLFPANENDRGKVRQFVQTTLGGFARQHNCAVLLLAHPSVNGMSSGTGSSGSTAWNNTMRSRFYLSRPDGEDVDPDSRVLSRKKANYAARDAEIRIKWENGAFDLLNRAAAKASTLTWEQVDAIFDELAKGWAAGRPWSLYTQTRKSGRFLPDWAREYLQIPPKRLEKAISDWIRNGFVAYEEYDSHSKAKGLRVVRKLHPDA